MLNFFGSREPTQVNLEAHRQELLNDEEDDHNSRISAQDDIFDEEKARDLLRLTKLYQSPTNHVSFMISHMTGAQLAAQKIVNDLINRGAERLFDNYIGVKLAEYVLDGTNEISSKPIVVYFVEGDNMASMLEEEEEPPLPFQDTWLRNRVHTDKRTLLSEDVSIPPQDLSPVPSVFNESKITSKSKVFNSGAKDKKKEVKEAQPVPLDLPNTYDPEEAILEEQHRIQKERDIRVKDDKLKQDRQRKDEIKQQQSQLNRFTADVKQKQFTYDYEGNIIMIKPVKPERLAPQTYHINVSVSDDKIMKPEENKKQVQRQSMPMRQSTVLKGLDKKQVKKLEQEQKVIITPPIFDSFQPLSGVTITEGGRIKAGPRLQIAQMNVTNLSTLLNESGGNIRLSKSEYNQITRQGNLSRSNYANTREENRAKIKTSGLNELHQDTFDVEEKVLNLSNISELSILKAKNNNHSRQNSLGSIKISSTKQYDSILQLEETVTDKKEKPDHARASSLGLLPKLTQNENLKRGSVADINDNTKISPIDQYNMDILKARDWGKPSVGSMYLPTLNQAVKPSMGDIHSSLGYNKAKLPRERVLRQKELTIAEAFRLPPPMIGRTMGHGIKGGYNPSETDFGAVKNANLIPAYLK